jgi:hypothetical protein
VIDAWGWVRQAGRALEARVCNRWATVIVEVHGPPPLGPEARTSRRHVTTPLKLETAAWDQLAQEAVEFGVNRILATDGDIGQALYDVHELVRTRSIATAARAGGERYEDVIAVAESVRRHVNDVWVSTLQANYARVVLP